MTALVTLGVVATVTVAVDIPALSRPADLTVARANCRAVDVAILAYFAQELQPPSTIAQVAHFVQGDVSGYRIVAGKAVGPGCSAGPALG